MPISFIIVRYFIMNDFVVGPELEGFMAAPVWLIVSVYILSCARYVKFFPMQISTQHMFDTLCLKYMFPPYCNHYNKYCI